MAATVEPSLAPLVAAQLEYLLVRSPLPLKVDQIWSGCGNGRFSDRFTLLVPFCLDYIKWDIIYNAYYPSVAPDIVFQPEDEDFNPLAAVGGGGGGEGEGEAPTIKSSLADWDSKDHTRLLVLVHELRDSYMHYQKKRVGELDDARLKFEMSTIHSREGIEVCVVSGQDKLEEVKFAVPLLDMDLNKLVPACPWRQQQKIYLQLLEAVASIGVRRRFIEALAPVFGRPLEADPNFCRKATVLVTSGTFAFLFPRQQPILTMQSSQHFNSQGTPIMSRPLNEYPWSPRWDSSQMVERIFDFLVDECLNFKKYCNDALPQ